MKAICTTFAILWASILGAGQAAAHAGHLGDLAGHDHWIALGALGAAAGIALWAGLRGKKKDPDEVEAEEAGDEEELQEA